MASGENQAGHATSPSPESQVEATPITTPNEATPDDSGTETPKMAHDSMVTVRLSEPPALTLDTTVGNCDNPKTEAREVEVDATECDERSSLPHTVSSSQASPKLEIANIEQTSGADSHEEVTPNKERRKTDDHDDVNWERLEKTEDEQTKDEETDNVGYCRNTE
jgi:hypothetical protein